MTLSETFDENLFPNTTNKIPESTNTWNTLYNSQLWSDSVLREAVLMENIETSQYVPKLECEMIKDCYFNFKERFKKYDLDNIRNDYFIPNIHSTPNRTILQQDNDICRRQFNDIINHNSIEEAVRKSPNMNDNSRQENNRCIPSISRQIDSSFRQKFSSSEIYCERNNNRRIRKCMNGVGCIVSLSITDSPIKKRTQIQACSISVMIIAIVVISFVLVNITNPIKKTNVYSTVTVPTQHSKNNKTSLYVEIKTPSELTTTIYSTTTVVTNPTITTEGTSTLSTVIEKIRKNIRTYTKNTTRTRFTSQKPKEINNRDLSQRFCACQIEEVCMLEESSGTALCKKAIDINDPTGCGGLCAMETEACQLVDRIRGIRICRLLSLTTCRSDEWRCRNGLCVSKKARCDGSIDCYDRSDEMNCDCDLTKQFRCGHTISCFPNENLCDGIINCWDGYDEVNCTTECPESQFTCTDGQCILGSRFCDGFVDCGDGSDEPNGCDAACGAHELRCNNNRCVPRTARCDGSDQCGDATDEMHCS